MAVAIAVAQARAQPVVVDLLGPLGAAVFGETCDRPRTPCLAHRRRQCRVIREREYRLGKRLGFARGNEQPCLAFAYKIFQAADLRRDHRPTALHRLERDHPEALAERRHDDDLRLLDRPLDRSHVAEEAHLLREAELAR